MASFALFYSMGLVDLPRDLPMFYLGYLYMIWWSAAVGLIIGGTQRAHGVGRENMATILVSVHYFSRDSLLWQHGCPSSIRGWALLQPSLQAYEMIRAGMFGNAVKTYGDPAYTSLVLAVLTFIGLLLMRESRKYVVAE